MHPSVPILFPSSLIKTLAITHCNPHMLYLFRGLWGGANCRADTPCQTLRTCDCGPEGCSATDMYADQYAAHLQTLCPAGGGLAAFIAEGINLAL